MKLQFYYKGLEISEKREVSEYTESKLGQLHKFLGSLPENEVRLEVKVEKFARKAAYAVEFLLRLPGENFVASEDDHTLNEAIDFTLAKMMKQLRRRHAKLKKR
jgi:ribosomal subunit interface protein